MFLFKRSNYTEETEIVLTRAVQLGRDKIILGSHNVTSEEEINYYVEDLLIIESEACLKGQITATRCNIEGKVIGDIVCAEELNIAASAIIDGAILAKSVFMEAGCKINGRVVLDPTLEVTLLSIKLMEAEAYLENEDAAVLNGFDKEIEISTNEISSHHDIPLNSQSIDKKTNKTELAKDKNTHIDKNIKALKQNTVHIDNNSESDNWW